MEVDKENASPEGSSNTSAQLTKMDQMKFMSLMTKAKKLTSNGHVAEALDLYKKAQKICYSEKLQSRIQKMEIFLAGKSVQGDQSEAVNDAQNHAANCEDVEMSTPKKPLASAENQRPLISQSTPAVNGDEVDDENKAVYLSLVAEAKRLIKEENISQALEMYKKAAEIYSGEKLLRKIAQMEEYLTEKSVSSNTDSHSSSNNGDIEMSTPVKSLVQKEGNRPLISQSTPAVNGDEVDDENKAVYLSLVAEAKRLIKEENISQALEMYKKAAEIYSGEKLLRKISQMEEYLRENPDSKSNSGTDKGSKSASELTAEDHQKFNNLVKKAKQFATEGNVHEALNLNKQALQIYYTEKLEHRIKKMEEYLQQHGAGYDNTEGKSESMQGEKALRTPKSAKKKSSTDVDTDDQRKFNDLVMKAKRLAHDGNITEALDVNRQALKIHYSEKLQKRIAKMEEYLKNEDEEEEDSGMIDLGHNFFLYKDLADKLYAHQREGVLWMWGLHVKRKGGILGDDMGLGKTIQVIAFLSGLFDMDKVKSVLIVMPVSVIVNWEKEFSRWAPGIRVNAYHGTKKEKDTALLKVQKRGGVLLTSYGLVVTSWEKLGQIEGREFKWDYMILDEGHKIKNPTKTTKGVHQIGAKNRIILTGTPIQNNLRELWSLFDFVHQGSLLGTSRTFKMEFENPITRARERDATAGERKLGMEMAESLKKIIAPYFLRRTKAEVTEKGIKKENSENPEDKKEKHLTKMPSLTRKNDFIVWLFLTPTQQRIYSDFLSLDHVKELLMTKKSPLVALTVLKKICDHPRLLSRRGCAQLGLDGDHRLDELDPDSEEGLECAANQIKDVADEMLIGESGKVIVVVDLLDKMKEEGHRCLVFSQSRKMLDVIEQVIKNRGHKVMRLDGTVTQLAERDARIGKFQNDTSYSVFLLTTQVGGVGLTLTAADRVIIFDPSWNPATDAQAVDRVFRIGQDKNVVIYRLITCGTVEEKIYRRQIFKDSITRQTTGNSKNPYRYFTKQELRELFTLDNPRQSKTQIQLEEMHSGHRKTDPGLDAHVAFLYSLDIFGLSDHDLMFTQEKCDIDHPDDDDSGRKPMDHKDDYIQHRVQKAQELIRLESDLSQNFNERSGNQQRTVDGGQSGMNRPFAQPWQNWNFQGNIKNEEDFDGSEDKQKPVKTEPTVSIKSESDSDVVDLTQIEDKDTPIDLTTPPESPKAKERHFHSPHSPPSNRPIKREPEQEDKGEVTPDVPPHSSLSKDLSIQIEEDSESATRIVEDFDHMSISESPQTSPVKVKREKVTPDKNAQMNGGLDSSVKVKVKEEVMTSDTEDEGKQSSGSLDRSGNTSGHGTVENDDVFTEPSLAKGNLTSANENDVIDLFTNENEELATSANEDEELTTSANENDVIDLSTNENEDTTTSANESGALSLSANENPGMRLLSNQNDKEDQYIPQPSVGLSRDEELPIINMVTPSKKGRRRSVSQSPWLKKTPKSGSKNVIREEILISPDFNRPMVDIKPTRHQHSPRNGKNKVNLDCTILSALQDSPNIDEDKSRSRSHENALGMTFVGESPVADVQVTHLHCTVVQDSPNTSLSRSLNQSTLSFNQSTDVVLDSVQNTPAVAGKSTVAKNSNDVIIGDSEGEETPKASRSSKISRTSVNESESEEELPIMSFKKKKPGTIIDSEDSANEDDEIHDSASKTEEGRRKLKNRIKSIENSESDEESMDASKADSDVMEISGTQEDENMTGESLTDESEEEEEEMAKSSKKKKKNYVSDDEEEEEDDDEGDDSMSGFIVDDSDEELDDDEEEDEASHGSEDDDETDEDDRMGKGTHKGASKKHSGSSGFSKLPAELQAQYKDLEKNSKHLYKTGQYNEALVHVLQALEIYPDENMQALALKIHQKMMS